MRTLSVGLLAAAAVAISMVLSRSRPKLDPGATGAGDRAFRGPLDQIRAAGL